MAFIIAAASQFLLSLAFYWLGRQHGHAAGHACERRMGERWFEELLKTHTGGVAKADPKPH